MQKGENMQIEGTGKAKINIKRGLKNYLNMRELNNIIFIIKKNKNQKIDLLIYFSKTKKKKSLIFSGH